MHLHFHVEGFLNRLVLSLKDGSEEDVTLGLRKLWQLNLDGLGVEAGRPQGRQTVVRTQ